MTDILQGIPTDGARVRALDRSHVFHTWSAQAKIDPLPIKSGRGSYFTDFEDVTYLDFSSQLVHVNLGYQHPRLVAAIQERAAEMCTIQPAFAGAARSEAARLVTEAATGDLDRVLFTNSGAEAVENAVRLARLHTGRLKVLSAYRSYHGATAGAITLTGESRRWPSEPGIPGVVHFWGPYLYRSAFSATSAEEECARSLRHLRDVVAAEGSHSVAAIILETIVGGEGVLVPPDGYLSGVRALCDEHGIVMILDEVMAGFGRAGEWFATDRWNVVPDLMTFAKGVTSGYVPLGGVLINDAVNESFQQQPYPGGVTYSGHALACGAAVASINILRDEGVVEHARALGQDVIGPALDEIGEKHCSVGDVRGLGVFWALELVQDRQTREPMTAPAMAEFAAACKARGLWPVTIDNRIHIVPPCTITADEVRQGLAIIDECLMLTDKQCSAE